MMNITFLAHSGLMVELPDAVLLFDWWKGELPPLPDKPLLVFASHSHSDHFKPEIFALDDGTRFVRFILGSDISLDPKNLNKWGVTADTLAHITSIDGLQSCQPLPGVIVETMFSTDSGVAFLVSACGKTIYHAGDLHWWHWEGEPDPWNPDMERNFKKFIEPLRGKHIDLAMAPLDSRLEDAEAKGLLYLLKLAEVDKVIPVHQWEKFETTDRFMTEHPQWAGHILKVTRNGQTFTLP